MKFFNGSNAIDLPSSSGVTIDNSNSTYPRCLSYDEVRRGTRRRQRAQRFSRFQLDQDREKTPESMTISEEIEDIQRYPCASRTSSMSPVEEGEIIESLVTQIYGQNGSAENDVEEYEEYNYIDPEIFGNLMDLPADDKSEVVRRREAVKRRHKQYEEDFNIAMAVKQSIEVDQLVPELNQHTPELHQVPSELNLLAPEWNQLAPEWNQLVPEWNLLAPELNQVPPELNQVPPELNQDPPELNQFAPEFGLDQHASESYQVVPELYRLPELDQLTLDQLVPELASFNQQYVNASTSNVIVPSECHAVTANNTDSFEYVTLNTPNPRQETADDQVNENLEQEFNELMETIDDIFQWPTGLAAAAGLFGNDESLKDIDEWLERILDGTNTSANVNASDTIPIEQLGTVSNGMQPEVLDIPSTAPVSGSLVTHEPNGSNDAVVTNMEEMEYLNLGDYPVYAPIVQQQQPSYVDMSFQQMFSTPAVNSEQAVVSSQLAGSNIFQQQHQRLFDIGLSNTTPHVQPNNANPGILDNSTGCNPNPNVEVLGFSSVPFALPKSSRISRPAATRPRRHQMTSATAPSKKPSRFNSLSGFFSAFSTAISRMRSSIASKMNLTHFYYKARAIANALKYDVNELPDNWITRMDEEYDFRNLRIPQLQVPGTPIMGKYRTGLQFGR